MIKKLRIKLIAVAMLAMIIVVGTIVTVTNIINYTKAVSDADTVLSVLEQNEGKFPDPGFMHKNDQFNTQPSDISSQHIPSGETLSDGTSESTPSGEAAEPGGEMLFRRTPKDILNSPETRFESRFFTVKLDDSGNASELIAMEVAAIDEEEALSLGENIYKNGSERGFYEDYRYARSELDGGSMIIFLDRTRSLSNVRNTLITSILVALLGLGAVFVLLLIFSRRIVRPVSESYEKQKEFITNAGHEIKTPLSIISADAEVLEMDTGENEWIDDIKAQTKRLASLTNDLVFLAKMEETDRAVAVNEFSLSDIFSEIVKSFGSRAKTGHKTYASDIEEGIIFNGEQASFEKLISILLDNAIKYTPEGGYIYNSLSKQKNKIILSVSNTVKDDLNSDDLEHFFDRFYRTDKSRNSKTGGYGIGLSVAKAVVERHKGKIRAFAKDVRLLCIEVVL